MTVNPVLLTLLLGTRCPESPLNLLAHHTDTVVPIIWELVKRAYKESELRWIGAPTGPTTQNHSDGSRTTETEAYLQWISNVWFPEPQDLVVNMMPFKLDDLSTIPEEMQGYISLITDCLEDQENYQGKIGYLTIHESKVEAGQSQRRGGLHIESPGLLKTPAKKSSKYYQTQWDISWGFGTRSNLADGGIYMASTTANTCRAWSNKIRDMTIVEKGGDIEHLRFLLGKGEMMEPSALYWLSDRTPHESLPVTSTTYRQFFRLVTGPITVWFADHSTPNPLGVKPEAKVIYGNKFTMDLREALESIASEEKSKVVPFLNYDK